MTSRYLPILGLAALAAAPLFAGPGTAGATRDWPQFRGPQRDGRSPETGIADAWPEGGPPLVWRRPIGSGFSGVSVAGGGLFTMAAYDGKEYALRLDPATGDEVWRVAFGEVFPSEFGDGPRSTPTVDGGRVYVLSARGRLAALAADDGKPLWQIELTEAFDAEMPRFGYAASALIEGDLLLVEAGGADGQAFAALDKTTGETRWTALDGPAAYSSPVAATFGGVRQIVFFRRSSPEIVSLLPDGQVYWTHAGLPTVIAMPLVVPPDGIFVSATNDAVGFLLRVGVDDGRPKVEEAWRTQKMKNHFNASVAIDGTIYGFDNAILKSLDAATGEPGWARRGFGKGSLIEADGHLIVLADVGLVALVEANPEEYVEKGRFQATTGRAWTAPTLAGGRLYVRDLDEIASFDLSAPASAGALREEAAPAEKETLASRPLAGEEEMTVDGVLARYAAARGGRERWRAVRSLAESGTYTSFSTRAPFRRLYKRPGLYLFDTAINGGRTVYGRDAAGAWWIDPLVEVRWAQRPPAGIARQLGRAAELEPPLLGAADKGNRVELAGRGEVNGKETLKLSVTLASGAEETWHLDPATFLEVAVDSKVLDYTQTLEPIDERAYFSDFREAQGLVIPHRVEREYLSRYTVLEIEEVEVDPPLADASFALPLADAMEALRPLAGEWDLTIEQRSREEQPWQTSTTTSTITPLLDGALLEERFTVDELFGPVTVVRQRSWDRFREVYRFTYADDSTGQMQVFEGALEDGRIVVSNAATGTASRFGDVEVLERQVTYDVGPDGFKVDWERSTDGGETWLKTARYAYTRPSRPGAAENH